MIGERLKDILEGIQLDGSKAALSELESLVGC
jgi:hypothetical protein